MNKKLILGMSGSALLFIGVFLPILSAPIVGSANYFQNEKGYGAIIIALSAVSAIAVGFKVYKVLYLTGFASLGLILYSFMEAVNGIHNMKAQAQASLKNNLFKGLGDAMLQSIHFEYGWAILFIGALLVVFAPTVQE